MPNVRTAAQSGRPGKRVDETVERFLKDHAHESAVTVITWGQIFRIILWAALLVVAILYWAHEVQDPYYIVTRLLCVFYLAVILFKLLVVFLSVARPREVKVTEEEHRQTVEDDLPVYTILVPLYREERVADKIIHW